ncbi:MAG: hypothetical protein HUJ29_07515 [Gammaproteobacteria bacterium]|nr:hypothetical protein [Gammaproteobacteria bacterium]
MDILVGCVNELLILAIISIFLGVFVRIFVRNTAREIIKQRVPEKYEQILGGEKGSYFDRGLKSSFEVDIVIRFNKFVLSPEGKEVIGNKIWYVFSISKYLKITGFILFLLWFLNVGFT